MLDQNKWNQYGIERANGLDDIKCIVIHNTGVENSAKEIFDWMNEDSKTSKGCSYLVDYNEVIQVMPDTWGTYNTGKGIDYACKYGIAIEICSNLDDDLYKKGQDKAIALVKELMETYNLTTDDIYFHCDFADFYCPKDILQKYGTKQNFIREEFLTNEL